MTTPSEPPARFPTSARVRRAGTFRNLLRGAVFPGRECLVRRAPNRAGHARLGIAAPRRYGGAVRRNRFRRLVREAFRREAANLGSFDYLVSPRKHLREPTLEGIRADLASTRHRKPAPPRQRRS